MPGRKNKLEIKRESVQSDNMMASDWEPIRALRQQLDRLVADFNGPDAQLIRPPRPLFSERTWPELGLALPPVDLVERQEAFELQAELPGVTQDQVEVKFCDGMMTISGEKSSD